MKALKALVIGMGILILLGLAVVIAAIVARVGGDDETADSGPGFGTLHLGLPESCRIADARPADGKLVLRLAGPAKDGCGDLIVVDPAEGAVLGRITPDAAPELPDTGADGQGDGRS